MRHVPCKAAKGMPKNNREKLESKTAALANTRFKLGANICMAAHRRIAFYRERSGISRSQHRGTSHPPHGSLLDYNPGSSLSANQRSAINFDSGHY